MDAKAFLGRCSEYLEGGLFHLIFVISLIVLLKRMAPKDVFMWTLAGAFAFAVALEAFKRRCGGKVVQTP